MSLFELCVVNILDNSIINIPEHLIDYFNLPHDKALIERYKSNNLYLVNYHAEKLSKHHMNQLPCEADGGLKFYISNLNYKELFPILTQGYGYIDSFRYIISLTSDNDCLLKESLTIPYTFNNDEAETSLKFLKRIYHIEFNHTMIDKFISINTTSLIRDKKICIQAAKEYCILNQLMLNNIKLI